MTKAKKKEINEENAELGRVSKYIVHKVKPWDTQTFLNCADFDNDFPS